MIVIKFVLQILPRERKKQEYLDAVKERYKHLPEIKRIVR
jgi:WD repeat and SOF domain-containing protein 1